MTTHLFLDSWSQKSEIGFTRLKKSKCGRGWILTEAPRKNPFPCLFQFLMTTVKELLILCSPHLYVHPYIPFWLSCFLACDNTVLPWIIQGNFSIQIFSLVIPAKSLLSSKETFTDSEEHHLDIYRPQYSASHRLGRKKKSRMRQ
jgi:hypothetical protein